MQEDAAGKLDLAFEDIGEQQLKNIARPVRVFRVAAKRAAQPSELPAALPLPDKPSVTVLPFSNMSDDPEQEFFADGIAEDVITALSRYPSLFVIARNSSFTYKDHAVDVKQVGRELGVRYVLEGSLRKAGSHIRVTAQLVEADTGKHVWAERYDRNLTDIFAVQDEITEAVTIAIAPAIAQAEQQRSMRKPPESLDAWAAYQRGWWHLAKGNAADNAVAEKFFQQAIDLDPLFAGGYTGLAAALMRAGGFQMRDPTEAQRVEEELARRAVALDGGDAEARARLALALSERGDHQGARAEAERALALCPNLPDAHGAQGVALMYSGRPKKGLAALETCIRLDPRGPLMMNSLGSSRIGSLLVPRVRGGRRGGKARDPIISRPLELLLELLPLPRRSARPARPDRGSEGSAGEGRLARAGAVCKLRPQPSALAAPGRPRPHARRPAQGRLAGLGQSAKWGVNRLVPFFRRRPAGYPDRVS